MIAQSDRANLVAGETFTVRVEALHRDNISGAEFATPTLVLPAGWQAAAPTKDQNDAWAIQVTLPKDATAPHGAADWMFPFAPPLVQARVHSTIDGYAFDSDTVVQAQRFTTTTVITEQLRVTPAVGLTLDPNEFLLAENPKAPSAAHPPLDVLIRVHSYSSAAQQLNVGLDVPADWHATAPQQTNLAAGADELLRFTVTPSAKLPAGDYQLKAWAKRGADTFRTSIEPLPSLPTYIWSEPAVAPVRAFPITVPQNLRVGYVAADIDLVPEAIQKLGIQVDMLDAAALTFGDLKRFDAIVIGIRAYELRGDVLANNQRLLDYANNGGTLILEYERDGFWNSLKSPIAPYPAKMEGGTLRITDEKSDVKFLAPDSPLLNFPNKITQDDFKGWVQERANYLWSSFDPQYQAVLSMHDPGEADLDRLAGLDALRQRRLHLCRAGIFPPVARRKSRRVSPVRQFAKPVPRKIISRSTHYARQFSRRNCCRVRDALRIARFQTEFPACYLSLQVVEGGNHAIHSFESACLMSVRAFALLAAAFPVDLRRAVTRAEKQKRQKSRAGRAESTHRRS